MEGRKGEVMMRKGPWMAEEDAILMNYVKKHGPRDWSSIRSKGLLPRTGKSCRLRWVNKLKPHLKTGCKFSAEEERVVIDLQAQIGNKWARIATYLTGRTDNDVKNFWSTRQKRLARVLQTPSPIKSQKNNGKTPIFHQVPTLEVPKLSSTVMDEESFSKVQSCPSSYMGNSQVITMVPLMDLVNPNLLSFETNLSQIDYTPIEKQPCTDPISQFPFPQFPQPSLDIPLLQESRDFITGPAHANILDEFACQETCESSNVPKFLVDLPGLGLEGICQNGGRDDENPATPDSFFDDFPTDMFEYLEPLPSSSEW